MRGRRLLFIEPYERKNVKFGLKRFSFFAGALALVSSSLLLVDSQAAEPKSVYIVKFADSVSVGNEISAARSNGIAVRESLEYVFKGFIGEMTPGQANALAKNPRVEIVEADSKVLASTDRSGATWGLDRIDQQSLPLNNVYSYTTTGAGVTAYVIDTGIYASHSDFGGRVASGFSAISDGNGTNDCNGHGTHVSGTIGGATYGVAPSVSLVPVRVLDCSGSGSISGVISGLNWVAKNKKLPAVANMSLGGGPSTTLDQAVNNLINAGVTVVVAAGNSNADACRSSPSRVPAAITVGATDSRDNRASFSNFGSCLDLFAPGVNITSDWISNTTATNTISGTSMATPHVAGVVARYLQSNPNAQPSSVSTEIVGASLKNTVSSTGAKSPNRLLFRSSSS